MTFAPALASGIDLIGAALLHFIWQGVLLGAVYVALRSLCANVVTRYRLGIFMLLLLALCPALTLAWIWPQAGIAASTANGPLQQMVGTLSVAAGEMPSSWHFHRVLPWLVAIWIGGVFIIGMRSLWQWRGLLRIVEQASALPKWEARLADLCARFGLRRPVRLMVSTQALTPMLIGLFKPVILLPASMLTGFAPDQLELIIAHELGHVRRWDYLVNLIQVVIETVLFYHPVVHWISRDVRNLREECCDDMVLHVARGNPLAYARTLADLEELRQNLAAAPALSAAGGILLNRVRRIVGATQMVDPLPRNDYAWPILVVVLAMACMVWRSHVTTAIPDAGRALAGMPAHALALVSGNPTLIEPVTSVALLPVTIPPLQNTDAQATPKASHAPQAQPAQGASETLFDPVHIAQPEISVALHRRIESVSDLVRL
ncbi:MAG TPA: M56 family metallopeptidase, partial [Rudaea sp.]|nr:M56 family metallopeptidase [Rudaea sp.]